MQPIFVQERHEVFQNGKLDPSHRVKCLSDEVYISIVSEVLVYKDLTAGAFLAQQEKLYDVLCWIQDRPGMALLKNKVNFGHETICRLIIAFENDAAAFEFKMRWS